jgi:hypothetical protein
MIVYRAATDMEGQNKYGYWRPSWRSWTVQYFGGYEEAAL